MNLTGSGPCCINKIKDVLTEDYNRDHLTNIDIAGRQAGLDTWELVLDAAARQKIEFDV